MPAVRRSTRAAEESGRTVRHAGVLLGGLGACCLLVACATAAPSQPVTLAPAGGVYPAASVQSDYQIGPQDKLDITVFQVPDLTLKDVQVDSSGQINLPLVGVVTAAGKSTQQLSSEIATRLRENYLQNPQVSVVVAEALSQKVTVEGAIMQPGVYSIAGPTTLLQVIAMARGPDKLADLRRVAIFRNTDGRRAMAVFDLGAIRKGEAVDPEVRGDDVVVVQGSGAKAVWQDVIRAAPIIGVFRYF